MKKSFLSAGFRRVAAVVATGALVLGATVACSNDSSSPTSPDTPGTGADQPYKVGLLLGLTGGYSGLGTLQRQAIELYFNDVNESGGINGRQIEFTVIDSTSDEATAVNQFRRLATEDEVDIVIGPSSSGESIALRSVSASLETPVMSLGASQEIVQPPSEATWIFKAFNDTSLAVEAQIQYAKEQGWNRVALLSSNTAYGQDAVNVIDEIAEEYDVEVVASETFDAAATDVTPQLTKLAGADPDVLLVWAVNPANAVVSKSAASIDFAPVVFHSGGAGSPIYIENAGAAAENTLVQGSKVLAASQMTEDDPQLEVTQDFVERFTAEYGFAPGQYEASAWDAAILLQNALETMDPAITDLQEVRQGIRDALEAETKDLVGVNGVFTFRSDFHGPTGLTGLAILRVENGEFLIERTF